MQLPSEAERKRVGEKFAELARQLRANQIEATGRKRFTPYTDAELRAMYPPREPVSAAAEEPAEVPF